MSISGGDVVYIEDEGLAEIVAVTGKSMLAVFVDESELWIHDGSKVTVRLATKEEARDFHYAAALRLERMAEELEERAEEHIKKTL
jgi:uncharacterized protein YneR